jgi:two-component system LytT family response regulator
MRLLIVDDERPARDKLRRLLEREPDVRHIDEAGDGYAALERIAASRPDAVFLDIQMPEISGIELAASLPAPAPLVVFVTAYDRYAIEAFDANAIDYLLKPYDGERLRRALGRVRERLAARPDARPADGDTGMPVRRLLISERGVTRVILVDDIDWIETADNYVVLHTAAGHWLMRQTLSGLLARLGPAFVRCHRRAAVRRSAIDSVAALDKGDGEVLLRGGARVPYSRQYRAALLDQL